MPKLEPYSRKLPYSYQLGVFPALNLLEARPECASRLLLHPQGLENEGVVKLRAICRLSLPNAAHTAFLYGVFLSCLSVLRALRPGLPLNASVAADFRSMHTQLDFCGILSCRLGHIMAAGLIWCRDYLTRRLHTWITNSRSKAS